MLSEENDPGLRKLKDEIDLALLGTCNPHTTDTDLDTVTRHVHDCCKSNPLQWAMFGNDRYETFEYLAIVLPFDDFWGARCDSAPSPQRALLAACVEAALRLKAA